MSIRPTLGWFSGWQPGTRKPALPYILKLTLLPAVAAWLLSGATEVLAQDKARGNKPGSQEKLKAMTRLMDRYRAKLEVKDDAEWKIIQERIEKVLRANRELQTAVFLANYKNPNFSNKHSGRDATSAKPGDLRGPANGGLDPDVRALKKLVETKGTPQEIKAALARVRAMLRERQEQLTSAQEDLRAVLSARQEGIAVLNGLLR